VYRRSISRIAGIGVLLGVACFTAIIIVLHFVQPEYQAARQLMSELADGRGGGAVIAAFVTLAAASVCAERGLSEHRAGPSMRLLLVLSAAGFLGAGVFKLSVFPVAHVTAIVGAFASLTTTMLLSPRHSGIAGVSSSRKVAWSLAAGAILGVASVGYGAPLGVVQRASAVCVLSWLALVGIDLVSQARADGKT
jgi:hypothetical protein